MTPSDIPAYPDEAGEAAEPHAGPTGRGARHAGAAVVLLVIGVFALIVAAHLMGVVGPGAH